MMLGLNHRMREPRPAKIRSLEKSLVDELEHLALFRAIANVAVDPGCRQQRILGSRIELEDSAQPLGDAPVVQLRERNADARLIVERLEPQHEQLRCDQRIARRRDPQAIDGRRRGKRIGMSHLVRPNPVPAYLRREPSDQKEQDRSRHESNGSRPHRLLARSPLFAAFRNSFDRDRITRHRSIT